MKNTTKKTASKRATKTRAKTTLEKLGSALASTAAFLASAVPKDPDTDPNPRATDLLVHQHRQVETLLDRLESPKVDVDGTLRELADALTAHIAIEEKLFYPAIRKLDPDLILEGLEEHAMGRFALKRLLGTPAGDHSLKARLKALKELMTNHHKEEEKDLFPKARKAMSNDALEKLGTSMKTLFDADVKRGHEAVLATSKTTCGSRCAQSRRPARGARGARGASKRRRHAVERHSRAPGAFPTSPRATLLRWMTSRTTHAARSSALTQRRAATRSASFVLPMDALWRSSARPI